MALRMVSVVVAFAVSLVLMGGPYAGTAFACSCALMPLKAEIKNSDAVFSGEVLNIDEGATPDGTNKGTGSGFTEARGKISIAVRDTWKGVSTETVDVYGQGDGVNCYNLFEEGEAYLVYASRAKGLGDDPAPLKNVACGATKQLAYAEKDLRLLGSPTDRLAETGGPPLTLVGVLAAAAVLSVSAGVLLRWARP